jgi:hypothetical protein
MPLECTPSTKRYKQSQTNDADTVMRALFSRNRKCLFSVILFSRYTLLGHQNRNRERFILIFERENNRTFSTPVNFLLQYTSKLRSQYTFFCYFVSHKQNELLE